MTVLRLDTNLHSSDGSGIQQKIWVDPQHLVKVNTKKREAVKEVTAYKLTCNEMVVKEASASVSGYFRCTVKLW